MVKHKIFGFLVLCVINLTLLQIYKIPVTNLDVVQINVFLMFLSFIEDLINLKFSNLKKITPVYVLITNFLRIVFSLIFLLPTILNFTKNDTFYIYNFGY